MMKKLLLFLAFWSFLVAEDATITVVNKGIALPTIAIEDASGNFQNSNIKTRFWKVLVGDLKVGSAFNVLDEYRQANYDSGSNSELKGIANYLIRYELAQSGGGISLRFKIFNVDEESVIYEDFFSQNEMIKFPFLAHKAVAQTAKKMNLSPIDWMDKMILISQYTAPGQSSILVADYTLTYQKVVLSQGLNIFPKWANNAQSAFYYTTYINSTPTLFRFDLASGQRAKITQSTGMLVASDVSSDGSKLLLTMAPDDQSEIFLYDLRTQQRTQITKFSGIDVGGNFIDNDSRIVFVSDRLGYPNIFSTSINGGAVEQMVFHGRNNNSITTHGNYVVYSSRESSGYDKTTFNLYLISTKTDYIRQLTAGGINTFPRFSSDGGSVIFIKNSGRESAVGIIRLNENKSFQFPLRIGKLQSIDW